MPKSYRNTWGVAVCHQDRTVRMDDRSLYVFTHDFDSSKLPEIRMSIEHAHRRVIGVEAREGIMTIAIRHRDLAPKKGETYKRYQKRTHAEAASVLGDAFGAVGRYVERTVRSGNRRAYDRRRTFRPVATPVYV